jgi:hypothetical protein
MNMRRVTPEFKIEYIFVRFLMAERCYGEFRTALMNHRQMTIREYISNFIKITETETRLSGSKGVEGLVEYAFSWTDAIKIDSMAWRLISDSWKLECSKRGIAIAPTKPSAKQFKSIW